MRLAPSPKSILADRAFEAITLESLIADTDATEIFIGSMAFESEQQIAEATKKPKQAGRLGRLTYSFRTADVLNGNRRIYPSDVVQMAIEALKERIARNVVFGCIDHPSAWDPQSLIVTLKDAGVKIVEVTLTSDTDVKVVLDILDNPFGAQLVSVLNIGGNPGISQRGLAEWREPTEAERERYKVPANEYAVVAKVLRLITYDVVSEPGFADAAGARVTEHQGAVEMNRTELQKAHPALFQEILTEGITQGRAAALAELPAMIESELGKRKPALVEEAIKPVNDKLAAEIAKSQKLNTQLSALKPMLVEAGIVNEHITDAQAASKIATLEAKVAALETEKGTMTTEGAKMRTELDALKTQQAVNDNLRLVSNAFSTHPHHNDILKQVAAKAIADPSKAMEAAKSVAAFIDSIAPKGAGTGAGNGNGTGNGTHAFESTQNVLSTLLKSNHADGQNGSGGRANEGVVNPAAKGVMEMFQQGVPSIL